MTEKDFIPGPAGALPESGSARWQAPSNIALVKYWGKKAGQIPTNPSVSFTLDSSATRTELRYRRRDQASGAPGFEVFLDGRPAPGFREKIRAFFERILPYQPFVSEYDFEVHTTNTFPHSSGIASSASGMAALALCLADLERAIFPGMEPERFTRKASFLARLGSGSAARSIEGSLVHWGQHGSIPGSSDLYGIRYPLELHPVFESYRDTILLVDKGQKQVSSTAGHNLMKGHPFAAERFKQARDHIDALQPIFRGGDLEAFISLVESEALTLHAMMMTSDPYFLLMKPATLQIIERIWEFRRETGEPVCFTLDAGANVHFLYPKESEARAYAFVREQLVPFCEEGQHLCDQVGKGAVSF
ncbi:diphosphomevalonate/mevalonate 3,5-bisphosphate decarboxylase family protein [Robiginitalea marina]|uniref:Diphosphomevalonate decarboxylase n=1 Tax=Robiginitalea marina TaxID=2954105 RepID=A0ABT1AZL3_9FLAO|nr:diphosphomevalonate decarboxylase [Robiginitalea marina]MCO5724618.1 diphosphomevalonate decarboxylase [Robiginitalea marina]